MRFVFSVCRQITNHTMEASQDNRFIAVGAGMPEVGLGLRLLSMCDWSWCVFRGYATGVRTFVLRVFSPLVEHLKSV